MRCLHLIFGIVGALALSAPSTAPPPRRAIQPGHGIGRLVLGMGRPAVHSLLRNPSKTLRLRNGLVEEYWLLNQPSYAPGIDILFRNDKVVQIETTLPYLETVRGDAPGGLFLDILKKHKNLRVSCYSWTDLNDGAGYVRYFYDDVKEGIAFTIGTQDDEATSQIILSLRPETPVKTESILIHPSKQTVIAATGTARVSPSTPAKALQPSFLYNVIKVQYL